MNKILIMKVIKKLKRVNMSKLFQADSIENEKKNVR